MTSDTADRKFAVSLPQNYRVMNYGTLPDGEEFLVVGCLDYSAYCALPHAMEFEGKVYGLTGWNSDTCNAYYKRGAKIAKAIR